MVDTYHLSATQRTNRLLKRVSALATILLAILAIVGVGAAGLLETLGLRIPATTATVGGSALVALLLGLFFYARGWL